MPADGGIRFGQYLLLRRIARGGMAEVFLAQQRGLEGFDRRVAVKRILPHLLDSPDFVRMFLGEAKLAAQLSHPNIVHIYDFGKVDHDYFLAMEYVEGVHAGQVFKLADKEKMPPTLVARIGADAASALHYAHDLRGANGQPLGLVHRDVSPANIMISHDGVVKLCDFGIAKAALLSDQLTNPGQVKGKYAYMSPEQTVASQLDGRSDVFSLAIVLWELLTGKFIVTRGDAVEAMRALRDGKIEPLAMVAPATPAPLVKAITWALEPKRDKRATAAQFGEALETFIKSSPELATSMQLATWIRTRFPRDSTGLQPALPAAPGGTAAAPGTSAAPSTLASPGTVIASGTQGPITPPAAASKIAARLVEDRSGPFGSDLDEEVAQTIKKGERPARPPPTLQLTQSSDTVIEDMSQRAAEESTLRDRHGDTEIVDALATVQRDTRPPPAVAAVMPTTILGTGAPAALPTRTTPGTAAPIVRDSALRTPKSAPRSRGEQQRKRRRMRLLLAIGGLSGLALVSFAIAPVPIDAGMITSPSDADVAVPPAPADAAVAMGYLEVRTVPPGGTIKVGDQTRTAPAQLIIPAGHVAVTAELAGFANERREVDLEPGEHHEVEIAFTKKLKDHDHHGPDIGKLTVRTLPYSDVYEGGTLIGTTPFAEHTMTAGTHTLVFKNPKHATIEKKITIVAGKTLKLSFLLP